MKTLYYESYVIDQDYPVKPEHDNKPPSHYNQYFASLPFFISDFSKLAFYKLPLIIISFYYISTSQYNRFIVVIYFVQNTISNSAFTTINLFINNFLLKLNILAFTDFNAIIGVILSEAHPKDTINQQFLIYIIMNAAAAKKIHRPFGLRLFIKNSAPSTAFKKTSGLLDFFFQNCRFPLIFFIFAKLGQ